MANSKGIHQIALDDIDLRTLQALQDDSRLTTPELAGKVELSSSPCHRRVRLLEERGVIKRYVALLYQKAVALPASVFVSIKLESTREEALNRFNRAIAPWPEISGMLPDARSPRQRAPPTSPLDAAVIPGRAIAA